MSQVRSLQRVERHGSPESAPSSRLGRVVHDPRGNAVWDWAIETDVLARTSTHELLEALVDPAPLRLEADGEPGAGWCGDPYNRSCAGRL